MIDEEIKDRSTDPFKVWGFSLTAAYAIFVVIYSTIMWPELIAMTPHDFAECLAGAFGPLAFLWVILGYLQQGVELKNSVDALGLQARAANEAAKQQEAMAEISRKQFEAAMAQSRKDQEERDFHALPKLRLESNGWSSGLTKTFRFKVTNIGPSCTDLRLENAGDWTRKIDHLNTNQSWDVDFEFPLMFQIQTLHLELHFIASNGTPGVEKFMIPAIELGEDPSNSVYAQPQRVHIVKKYPQLHEGTEGTQVR